MAKNVMGLRFFSFLIFFLSFYSASAQWEHDGGVMIHILLDKKGRVIHVNDPALTIRKFAITPYPAEGFSIRPYYDAAGKKASLNEVPGVLLPLTVSVSTPENDARYKIVAPTQLIQFFYKGDTSFFRFEDLPLHSFGQFNTIDTLQLLPGSYVFSFKRLQNFSSALDTTNKAARDWADSIKAVPQRRGITPGTAKDLLDCGLLHQLLFNSTHVIFLSDDHRRDTTYLPNKPVNRVSLESFTTRRNTVSLDLQSLPIIEKDTLLYRLQMWPFIDRIGTALLKEEDEKGLEEKLSENTFLINGKPYTGRLEIFWYRPNPLPRHKGPLFRLDTCTFQNGHLLRITHNPFAGVDSFSEEPPRPEPTTE